MVTGQEVGREAEVPWFVQLRAEEAVARLHGSSQGVEGQH